MASFGFISCLSVSCILIVLCHINSSQSQVMVPTTTINCTTYNASQPCLPGDRNVFCLTNGTTIRGICDTKVAVCLENAEVSDTMTPCLVTTMTPASNNTASPVTSSSNLRILSSSLLVWIWHVYSP